MKKLSILIMFITSVVGVSAQAAASFTESIEKAHKKELFMSKKYLTYTIDIEFGGKQYMSGTITQEPGGGKIKIEKKDGSLIIFDGTNVYGTNITEKAHSGARFDIFTWAYFFGLPYKLNDEGTLWSNFEDNNWGGENLKTGKLAFTSTTGDAPDDWYIVYVNKESNILKGAAYIVSFGKGKEKAEKEPHAIKYSKYKTIEEIPFASHWTFHMWNKKEGYKEQIGEVKLSNIKFTTNADFSVTKEGKLIKAPKS